MQRTLLGAAALLLAIAFNLPFALLAASFDYPDILRRPAGEVLDAFAAGGTQLILIWYAFALSAVGLIFFAPALALTTADWTRRPGLAVAAALMGALAGSPRPSAFSAGFSPSPRLPRCMPTQRPTPPPGPAWKPPSPC